MRPLLLSAVVLVGAGLSSGCHHRHPVPPPPPPPEVVVVAPPPSEPPPPSTEPSRPRRRRPKVTEFKVEGDTLRLPRAVEFETGSDKLSPTSDEVLEHVHDYLDSRPDVTLVRIEGHTDSDGNAADNLLLSQKRALSVARWLVGVGVSCSRLVPVGFGQTKPLVMNDTPENKALNRRVHFVNAAINGRPTGNKPVDGGGVGAGDPCH
jgi:OmpA-OmpF porin, OOP family